MPPGGTGIVAKGTLMTMSFDKAACRNFENSINLEWLATNGLGGYASGTVCGANTRKYQGYLVVAAHPPVQRFVMLSRVEDRAIVNGVSYDLGTDEFPDIIHPQGYQNLISFEQRHGPIWRYQCGDAVIEKSVTLVHGQDAVIVRYRMLSTSKDHAPARLYVQPMFAGRDFHATIRANYRPSWQVHISETEIDTLLLAAPECPVKLALAHNADSFNLNACWWYNFIFRQERIRGYPDRDDLWTPGALEFTLEPGTPVGFICATKPIAFSEHAALVAAEEKRYQALVAAFEPTAPGDDFLSTLSVAAEQFVVRRGPAGAAGGAQTSVIAGYPWFEDWGRDTFISLPGLTLVTGRFDAARSILVTFADHMRNGLLPNRFPDKAFKPDYNTVDASLWFVHAAYQYWRYSGDVKLLCDYLYRPLVEVIEKYRDGTEFDIRMEEDGLIRAGAPHTQLTWMDAKVGDWVVTPRHGKPVEINALWYNALRIMALLGRVVGDSARVAVFTQLAELAAASFTREFWNRTNQCLFDVIDDNGVRDPSIRPNQLMAVSLPFSPLSADAQAKVVETAEKLLVTPMGLRTLAPGSPGYHGRCAGDQLARDMAYHQGTVWPWLIGPFVSGYVKVHGGTAEARKKAGTFLDPFRDHLHKAGLGSISEIADGDPPFTPRGCIAQAWSVGEVLRAYWEDVLAKAPAWPHERPDSLIPAAPPLEMNPRAARV